MGFIVLTVVAEWQVTQRTGMRAVSGCISSMGANKGASTPLSW
jgi:hypothetical protein